MKINKWDRLGIMRWCYMFSNVDNCYNQYEYDP